MLASPAQPGGETGESARILPCRRIQGSRPSPPVSWGELGDLPAPGSAVASFLPFLWGQLSAGAPSGRGGWRQTKSGLPRSPSAVAHPPSRPGMPLAAGSVVPPLMVTLPEV